MSLAHPPTAFPELNEVLAALVEGAATTLGQDLVGVYLVGSFALGGADEFSDVDFMAIVEHDLDAGELERLQRMHGELHEHPSEWARHLDGSYAPAAEWRRAPAPGGPPDDDRPSDWVDPGTGRPIGNYPFLYLDNGARSVVRSDHDNAIVVRWVARHHGVTLAGPPPASLIDPIDDEALRGEVAETLTEWGSEIVRTPGWVTSLWRQMYLVISFCRMLQTLDTGAIHSKAAGVEWALANLEPRWHGLIERAWAERANPWEKVHVAPDPDEVAATLDFIRFAIAEVEGAGAAPH